MRKLDSEKFLTQPEAKRLLDVARGQIGQRVTRKRDYVLLAALLGTGLRAMEASQLRVGDLILHKRIVRVRCGKGGRSREVTITRELRRILERWVRGKAPGAPVFRSQEGRALSTRQIADTVKRQLRDAGLSPRLSTHSMRHTYGVHLYESTRDILLVREMMGHADLSTSLIYMHSSPEMTRSKIDMVEALI